MIAPPIAPAAVPAIAHSALASVPAEATTAPAIRAANAIAASASVWTVLFIAAAFVVLKVSVEFVRYFFELAGLPVEFAAVVAVFLCVQVSSFAGLPNYAGEGEKAADGRSCDGRPFH